MALIAPVITEARVYRDNTILIGTGDVTLPTIAYKPYDSTGAGILGTIAMPTPNLESLEVTINWHSVDRELLAQLAYGTFDLEIRGNQQKTDQRDGRIVNEGVAIFGSAHTKSVALGSFVQSQQTEGSLVLEMATLRVDIDRTPVFRVDKRNRILEVMQNGRLVDRLAEERTNL